MKWDAGEEDKRFGESKHLDMEKNYVSLFYVLERGEEQWEMTFGTSEEAKREIDKIDPNADPEYYKEKVPDLDLAYRTLRDISAEKFERDKRANKLSSVQEALLRKRLLKVVGDPDDVPHLLEFKNSAWDIFLTLDWNHVLRHEPILARLGVCVASPLDLLEDIIPFEMLIRTLHGSWETKPEIFRPSSDRWIKRGD
jgi:hypothetical protein